MMIGFLFYPDTKLPHLYSYESTVLIMNTGHVWLPVYAVARLYGCSCRAFGWLVQGWGLSHAVQDSLVSPAQLIRQKSSFLRGQARASAASMWTGHVSETADARMQ